MEGQLSINVCLAATHYGLIALSFALVSRTAKFFHVAHCAIFTLGAYITFTLIGTGVGSVASVVGGVIVGSAAGCAMDLIVFQRLRRRGASPEIQLLASFGLLVTLQSLISLFFGNERHSLLNQPAEMGISLLWGHATPTQLLAAGVSLSVAVVILLWSRLSTAGLILKAVGDDPGLSLARGIRTDRAILIAFAVASGAMALGGILQAADVGLTPLMGFQALLVGFAGALLGGLDSNARAYFGGVAIGGLEQLGAMFLPGQWYESAIYLLLIIVLVARGRRALGERIE